MSMYPVAAAALGFTGRSLYEILKLIMANIVDGKRDPIIEQLLSWLSKWLSEKVGVPLNLDRLWISIEESYTAIGDVDPVSGTVNTLDTENKVFDYSMKAYNTLRGTMQKIDNLTSGSISSWNSTYSSEKWYGDLGISIFVNGIESYGSRLKDINADCRSQIDRIFEKVWTIDSNKAKQLAGHGEQLKSVLTELKNLAESIG